MFRLICVIAVLLLSASSWSADSTLWKQRSINVKKMRQERVGFMFRADGSRYGAAQSRSGEAKMIVDTVRFDSDSIATIILNTIPSQTRNRTAPTRQQNLMVTGIMPLNKSSADYYVKSVSDSSVTIQSSAATDTALVRVTMVIQ